MAGRIGSHSHCDTACDRCNNGTFSDHAGATQAIDCHVCPPGTQTDLHAGYRACACAAGHYRLERFGLCRPCTDYGEGVVCVDEAISLQPGYWWQFRTAAHSEAYERYTDDLKLGFDYNHSLVTFDSELLPSRAHVCKRPASCFGEIRSDCDEGYTGGKVLNRRILHRHSPPQRPSAPPTSASSLSPSSYAPISTQLVSSACTRSGSPQPRQADCPVHPVAACAPCCCA